MSLVWAKVRTNFYRHHRLLGLKADEKWIFIALLLAAAQEQDGRPEEDDQELELTWPASLRTWREFGIHVALRISEAPQRGAGIVQTVKKLERLELVQLQASDEDRGKAIPSSDEELGYTPSTACNSPKYPPGLFGFASMTFPDRFDFLVPRSDSKTGQRSRQSKSRQTRGELSRNPVRDSNKSVTHEDHRRGDVKKNRQQSPGDDAVSVIADLSWLGECEDAFRRLPGELQKTVFEKKLVELEATGLSPKAIVSGARFACDETAWAINDGKDIPSPIGYALSMLGSRSREAEPFITQGKSYSFGPQSATKPGSLAGGTTIEQRDDYAAYQERCIQENRTILGLRAFQEQQAERSKAAFGQRT